MKYFSLHRKNSIWKKASLTAQDILKSTLLQDTPGYHLQNESVLLVTVYMFAAVYQLWTATTKRVFKSIATADQTHNSTTTNSRPGSELLLFSPFRNKTFGVTCSKKHVVLTWLVSFPCKPEWTHETPERGGMLSLSSPSPVVSSER